MHLVAHMVTALESYERYQNKVEQTRYLKLKYQVEQTSREIVKEYGQLIGAGMQQRMI